jgi:hypothetical protein
VDGGGEMGDDDEQSEPARSTVNPARKPALSSVAQRAVTSLSQFSTELDRLYSELGGPVPLRGSVDRKTFKMCCDEFSWREVEPTLRNFQKDRDIAKRHWPWVAFALGQYRFERKERQQNSVRLDPREVISLMNDIRRSAKELTSGLAKLQSYSQGLGDPTAPLEKPHLRYLDQLISQATARAPAPEVNKDPKYMLWVFSEKMSFFQRLSCIEAVAGEAATRLVDRDLLKRKKGQADPALYNLVWRGAEIWLSLTGRVPSPNRVHRRDSGEEPDFVLFIQDLVRLAGGERPSRKVVEISLGNRRTPDAG